MTRHPRAASGGSLAAAITNLFVTARLVARRGEVSMAIFLATAFFVAPAAEAQWAAGGVPVCTTPGDRFMTPLIVPDLFGGAIIVWQDYRNSSYGIYAQRLDAAGIVQWTPDGVLISGPSDAQGPVAVSNNGGGVIVAWVANSGSNSDVYAQNVTGSGTLLWGASGVPVCQAAGQQFALAIISDGRDPTSLPGSGAIVTWLDYRSPGVTIYAQSLVGNGATRWAANGVVVCSAPSWNLGKPAMATDGTGQFITTPKGAIIAWEDDRNGISNRDIYAQRLSGGTGAPQWTANGAAVCTAAYNQYDPKIDFVGSGNAIVAWADDRTGISYDTDIYAQRIGVSGDWATDGVPVCSPPGLKDAIYFGVISDLKGGGVFAWSGDGASSADIFAQRINAPGSPLWAVNGVPLSDAPGAQNDPATVSDGASGAIVAWDSYPDLKTIYAQRVDSSGVSRWYPGGLPICIAPGTRSGSAITSDGAGGAIVAWRDNRDGGRLDIYAQHVTSSGGVVGVEPLRPPGFQVVAASANPTQGPVRFRLDLPSARKVTARILGVDGRLVRTLVDGVELARSSPLVWDLGDSSRQPVPSGIYFLHVTAGRESRVQKIVSLR